MRPLPASSLLEALVDDLPADGVRVGEIIDRLDTRAHGALLLLLALPMCVPNVPGISTIFGILMIAPAMQLLLGRRLLWTPRQLRDATISGAGLSHALKRAIPMLKRLEMLLRPRLEGLTRFPLTIVVGFQTLAMALILILPIPFANWPPGMTVAMTALALLQRDGLLLLLTIPAAIISFASVYFGARPGWAAVHWLTSALEPLLSALSRS